MITGSVNNIIYFKNELVADFRNVKNTKARIVQIENLIDHLMVTALKSVQSGNIEEYSIDTGQTRESAKYRDPEMIFKTVKILESIKVYYENKLLPRQMRLVDQSNFRR